MVWLRLATAAARAKCETTTASIMGEQQAGRRRSGPIAADLREQALSRRNTEERITLDGEDLLAGDAERQLDLVIAPFGEDLEQPAQEF